MYWFRHHRRSLMRLTLTARGALLRRECGKSVRGAGVCGSGNEPGFLPTAAAAVPTPAHAGGTAMISSFLPSRLSAIPHRRERTSSSPRDCSAYGSSKNLSVRFFPNSVGSPRRI